jgi:hypothetical protein
MIIYVIEKTDKKGNKAIFEGYIKESTARSVANSKNRFGKAKGEIYEVIEREIPDGTILPIYSYR